MANSMPECIICLSDIDAFTVPKTRNQQDAAFSQNHLPRNRRKYLLSLESMIQIPGISQAAPNTKLPCLTQILLFAAGTDNSADQSTSF